MRVEFSFWGASNGLGEVFEQASRGTKHLKGFRFGVGSCLSGLIFFCSFVFGMAILFPSFSTRV